MVSSGGETEISIPFELKPNGKIVPNYQLGINLQTIPFDINGNLCTNAPSLANKLPSTLDKFQFENGFAIVKGSKSISDLEAEGVLPLPDLFGIMLIPKHGEVAYPTLTIDKNYFQRFSDICLPSGSTIKVEAGNVLEIRYVNIYTCLNVLANSIKLEADAKIISNACTIKDFRFAIDAKPNSIVSITNNNFIDNYIGLNLQMTTPPYRIKILDFFGNSFKSESLIKFAYPGMPEPVLLGNGYCGIRAQNYMDLNIFDGASFEHLSTGVLAHNTSGNLFNMSFDWINGSYPLGGVGIYMKSRGFNFVNIGEEGKPNIFNNVGSAIYLERMGGEVRYNTISAGRGVQWVKSQGQSIRIRNNTITAYRNGIISFQNEPLNTTGVYSDISANNINLNANSFGDLTNPNSGITANELPFTSSLLDGGWEIKNNSITTSDGGAGIYYNGGNFGSVSGNIVNNLNLNGKPYFGLYLQNNNFCRIGGNTIGQQVFNSNIPFGTVGIFSESGWANRFDCNCVDNTRLGIAFADLANFTDAVQGNRMNTHSTAGLSVSNSAFIGKQHHTGNKWDLTQIPANGFGGINANSNLTAIEASKFYVDGNENPSFNPPVSPGSDWFEDQSTPSATFSCSSPCNFIYPEVPLAENCTPNDLDMLIANGGLTTDFYYNEMRWKANYRLYRKIIRCPDLQNYNSTLSTFKTYNQNLATGKLAWVAEQRSKVFDISDQQQNTQNAYFDLIQQQRSAIATQDSIRQEGQQVNEQAYDFLIQQRLTTQAQFEAFQLGLKNNRNLQINTLLLYNAGISTTSITPAANQKTVNSILLAMILNDTILENDLTVLGTIANQCPLSGGDAVYEARSVVSYYTGIGFDDTQLCNTGQRPQSRENNNQTIEKKDILVFPNPNSGDLWISGVEGELDIRIINQLGQIVVKKTVTNNHLSIKALPKGIYIVQIFSPEQQLLSTRKLEKEN